MSAQPVAEQQVASRLAGTGREDMNIAGRRLATDQPMLFPVWFADTQHEPGGLEVREPGTFVCRISDGQVDVNHLLRPQAGNRGGSNVLHSESPLAESGTDAFPRGEVRLGPGWIWSNDLDGGRFPHSDLVACRVDSSIDGITNGFQRG